MDSTHLKMSSTPSSRPAHTTQRPSSRRVPVPSASMPQSSWLSDVGDFSSSSLVPDYLSVLASTFVTSRSVARSFPFFQHFAPSVGLTLAIAS
ncbi:hypothetical protein VTO73DRAFT_2726 [Trametes versicolor]